MIVKIIILLNLLLDMKIEIHEQKYESPVEIQRTPKIILTQEEYDKLITVFCKGKGWSLDHPHTVNVQSISLLGNYKWMPATDVEFHIEIDGQEKDLKEASNNDTKIDIEKEKFKA
jgi:hypothetical protein